MNYYDKVKQELTNLLADFGNASKNFDASFKRLEEQEKGVIQLAKERQVGFPWLAKAYAEFFELQDKNIIDFLQYKKHSAISASLIVKEQSRLRREAEKEKKIAQYLVEYYERIAPFLLDLKEEVDIGTEQEREFLKEYSEEELQDAATYYLTKEEYRKLPTVERNQMALDRFWKRPKSKWLIGRLYERYVGYLYEKDGYDVEYVGIFRGFEDLGRDLICKKGNDFIVIQCKNWAEFRTIYEKHVFQFFGTVFQYKDENKDKKVRAIFYTSTKLSDLARRFSKELNIELKENFKFDREYPAIKCNVSMVDGTKIYHLPFDQQYDKTLVEEERLEKYAATVAEAEELGFRRAFRWRGNKLSK